MKTKLLAGMALVLGCFTSHGQSVLNAGNIYTYEFATLPSTPGSGGVGFSFTPLFSGFGSGDIVQLRAFENSTAEAPWGTVQYASNASQDHLSSAVRWGDLQGVIQIEVLEGSVTLNSFRIQGSGFGQSGPAIYDLTVVPSAVPEPQTWCLLGAAGLMSIVRRRKWKV